MRSGRMSPARMRTATRFLARSLSLRGGPFLLGLLAITVGATITAALLTLRADLRAKMSLELRRYGPTLLVTPGAEMGPENSGNPAVAHPGTLDEARVRSLPAILAADPASEGSARAAVMPLLLAAGTVGAARQQEGPAGSAASGRGVAANILGTDFQALRRLYPSWRVNGAWPDTAAASCLVGSALAARAGLSAGALARVRVGSCRTSVAPTTPGNNPADIAPQGEPAQPGFQPGRPARPLGNAAACGQDILLAVSGIVSTGEAEDEEIFVPLARLQGATGLPGRVSLAALAIDGGAESVARAARTIEQALPGLRARPLRQIAAAQGAILGKIEKMMLLLTGVVLVLSGLCLVTTLMAIVVEREAEIGLMRSLGAADGDILFMLFGEVGLLGLAGGALGLALGVGGASLFGARLFGTAIEPRVSIVPLVLCMSLALCLIAVLLPLRRALAVQPAAALRGD